MATINPRLLPLIETLIGVGADWLAVELIETLNQGLWSEESEDVLALTRAQMRARTEQMRTSETGHKAIVTFKIAPEEQLAWAAAFVAERLDATIAELGCSIENLDVIIGEASEDAAPLQRDRLPTSLRLGGEDGSERVAASDLENARAGMQALRKALSRWASEADGQPT